MSKASELLNISSISKVDEDKLGAREVLQISKLLDSSLKADDYKESVKNIGNLLTWLAATIMDLAMNLEDEASEKAVNATADKISKIADEVSRIGKKIK